MKITFIRKNNMRKLTYVYIIKKKKKKLDKKKKVKYIQRHLAMNIGVRITLKKKNIFNK